MANAFPFFFFFTVLIPLVITINASENLESSSAAGSFEKAMDPKSINYEPEKFSHFRFYYHETVLTKPSSAINVVPSHQPSPYFGMIVIIDNPLRVGLEISSKLVGYAQGLYASVSQQDFVFLMNMNFVFIEGKYNGSTITVTGHNPIFRTVREMPVIGGSGVFRFARGYAEAKTYYANFTSLDAIIEYNVYVTHN